MSCRPWADRICCCQQSQSNPTSQLLPVWSGALPSGRRVSEFQAACLLRRLTLPPPAGTSSDALTSQAWATKTTPTHTSAGGAALITCGDQKALETPWQTCRNNWMHCFYPFSSRIRKWTNTLTEGILGAFLSLLDMSFPRGQGHHVFEKSFPAHEHRGCVSSVAGTRYCFRGNYVKGHT